MPGSRCPQPHESKKYCLAPMAAKVSRVMSIRQEAHFGGFSMEMWYFCEACQRANCKVKTKCTNSRMRSTSSSCSERLRVQCASDDQNVHGKPECTHLGLHVTTIAHSKRRNRGSNRFHVLLPTASLMSTAGPTRNPKDSHAAVQCAVPAYTSNTSITSGFNPLSSKILRAHSGFSQSAGSWLQSVAARSAP